MLFSTYQFVLVFLPVALVGYYWFPAAGDAGKLWLIAASLAFYAWGSVPHLSVLLVSLGINYLLGNAIGRPGARDRVLLAVGITFNLLLLGIFKYSAFIVSNLSALTGWTFAVGSIAFPLGISFFSLQQIIFLVDRYERIIPSPRFIDYAHFVTFFPYITSGPLVHWREAQLNAKSGVDYDSVARGLFVFLIGLLKKVVVADTIVRWVELGFASPGTLTFCEAWASALAFTFQLYYDFSGYTDMAIGLGLMFGMKLPINFASPYRALSIIDFWKRWHITLSRFITTYMYAPLLRSAKAITFGSAMGATLIAMVLAGLWHGPSWNYVLFGALHGVALVVNNVSRRLKLRVPWLLGWTMTFIFVVFAFVVFRSRSLTEAGQMIRAMAQPSGSLQFQVFAAMGRLDQFVALIITCSAIGFCFFGKNSNDLLRSFTPSRKTLALAIAAGFLGLLFMNTIGQKDFLYVDF